MKHQLAKALQAYVPSEIPIDPAVPLAAVLVLLYEYRDDVYVVFQKRTERVRDHKGQVSFPGGAQDPGDTDLLFTALRETHEEIGARPEDVEVLGRLDDIVTISSFRVTPYVGWLRYYPYPWEVSLDEVAYLLEVPLSHLRDPDNFVPDRRRIDGREYVLPAYEFKGDLIWGATARKTSNFLEIHAAAMGC